MQIHWLMITHITSLEAKENNAYTIQAVVQESHCISAATYFEPAEYGDGLCEASFILADDESLPSDEAKLRDFVDALELSWVPVDWN